MSEEMLAKTKCEVMKYLDNSYMLNVIMDIIDDCNESLQECKVLQQEKQQLKDKYTKLRDFIIDYGNWNGDELILEKIRTLEENNGK